MATNETTLAELSPAKVFPENSISSHVLDTANGSPGAQVEVSSYFLESDGSWKLLAITKTDMNGRVPCVHPNTDLIAGIYKLRFDVKKYFDNLKQKTFYPYAEIVFEIDDSSKHYHIPLTLSNYGYATYKGQ
uniref:5-hydroxyisourate hydrolase n=1 Tax=Panagrolaimus sp. JU765 TaxID=591449 RepID=A0AC34QK33_9BILA